MSFKKYQGSAGGWPALISTSKHLLHSKNVARNIKNLLNTNQAEGFDCPGCAWGENPESSRFRFCENGAKAVNWEATSKRVDAAFFQQHSVSYLKKQSDYYLEDQGRLAEPLVYNHETDCYQSISWKDAFKLIAEQLLALESPHQAEFYTSGRASNEAAFLYQLFVRRFGTNNLPDCSNMCHEASGVALKQSIGIGKGTVKITDFSKADAIFIFGQNPGTNHPRMLDALSKAAKRGAAIVSFNPLKERGLQRFTNPQSPTEMLTGSNTQISSAYYCPNLGGDMAIIRGIVKALYELEQTGESVFDHAFISEHCSDIKPYLAKVAATKWQVITQQSGLTEAEIRQCAETYRQANSVIITWAMGITQHKHSVATIQEIANLQLLCGNIGKLGAGLCPVRGHSNVQGDRTMGINDKPDTAFLNAIENQFGFKPPTEHGHNTVQAIQAMLAGQSKVFIALGGNFAAATPDTKRTEQALSQCNLTVHIATKLNRSHLITGKHALILPCLGRTDIDIQASGEQQITVEDSFSMVHASKGVVASNTKNMKSEIAIIAGIAEATLGNDPVNWQELVNDYRKIRNLIANTITGFSNFNQKITQAGGFYLGNSAAEHHWRTASGKAEIIANDLPKSIKLFDEQNSNIRFLLQTLRSHDQYNTTVYGFEDRYRGISGERNVLMINADDIVLIGLSAGDKVDITSYWHDGIERKINGYTLVPYDIPRGNCACYFPEANALVPLESYGDLSFTPTSKAITISLSKAKDDGRIL